jgi:opacity protein-like surface antigen
MSPRLWIASLVPLFATATAYAQAPGQSYDENPPAYGPYYAQPPEVAVAPGPQLPGRFSISLAMQSAEYTSNDTGESVQFDGGGFAIAYRPWRKVDLELSFGGGRQNQDGNEGDLAMASGTLAARYHFNQEQHWNFWLLFGVGATTIARHDASDEEIDAAQRPHMALGAGLEYRFTNLAIQLEARGVFLGQTEDEMNLAEQGQYTTEGISGGTIGLAAAYYFGR